MDPLLIIVILLAAIVLSLAGTIVFLLRKRGPADPAEGESQALLSIINDLRREVRESGDKQRVEVGSKMDRMQDQLMKSAAQSSSALQRQFQQTAGIIKEVTEQMTKLDETNKQVLGFSEQLQSLENILKNPKQRGILGEYWLDTLLGQVLQPGQYQMQFELGLDKKSGAKLIPDAALFIGELIVPIDAKFSLENYNKISKETDQKRRDTLEKEFKSDVKKRIDETSKYIQPDMGTTNFAFMFVPAEGVYHNLIGAQVGAVAVNSRNLIEYAFEKGVMIVSPTSFFAYLQTVLLGLKALKIEESVQQIQKQAEALMRHLRVYEEQHNKMGRHLDTATRAYNDSSKELGKIDKDIYRITEGAAGKELEPHEAERPRLGEEG